MPPSLELERRGGTDDVHSNIPVTTGRGSILVLDWSMLTREEREKFGEGEMMAVRGKEEVREECLEILRGVVGGLLEADFRGHTSKLNCIGFSAV